MKDTIIGSITHPAQRVGVFIDVQNVYHSAKNLYGARVNFGEVMKEVIGNRPIVRAVAYVVKSETAFGEDSFFEALKKTGLELRIKDLQVYSDGAKKADWDVGLAVDAIRMSNFLDVIILITGDGDFVPLVDYLKWGTGKQVEVAAFGRTTSSRLREAADKFTDLDLMAKALLRVGTSNNRRRKIGEGGAGAIK